MRDSIFYSAIRSLFVAFCAVIGIGLGIVFFTILIGALSTKTDNQLTTVNEQEIMPNAEGKREVLTATSPILLQINIDGIIGTEGLSMGTIKQQLIESREGDFKGDRVKGVLVYIDSPGGTVTDADGIYRALKAYKEKYKVPVYAYVNGLCASGGMYIACAADKVYSNDTSLIGSIGVIMPTFMNFTKLLDKVGVETMTLSIGTDKDAMNPLRPWKAGEEKNFQDIIAYYYNHFVNIVTSNRSSVNKEKLVNDYGARVFTAPQAMENGFIDSSTSSIGETIKELAKEAKIEGDYQVIKLENKDWWTKLFSGKGSMSQALGLLSGKITHQVQLSSELDPCLQNKFLYLYSPGLK